MPVAVERDQVQELTRRGARLVDVLPARAFEAQHLPGAVSVPLAELAGAASARLRRDEAVIVYCHDAQ
jgi:rhodanese-related sulfurtransferase